MKGDRERCLEAGMDGYVSKPIQAQKLEEEIGRAVAASARAQGWPAPSRAAEVEKPPAGIAAGPVFDVAAALERMGGDEELLREIAEMFLDDCPRLMSHLREAVARGDAGALGVAAHSLKGAAGNFYARAAVEGAQRLETAAEQGDLTGAAGALAETEVEVERLSQTLRLYRGGQVVCVS
jgi:HPt (histidine-containing phosphotransfer) domain-containing protein